MNTYRRPCSASLARARRWLLLVFLASVLIPLPVHGQAELNDICPSGCRYSSIQTAINASSPGTTLRIGPGTYYENITLRGRISLLGAGAGSTLIDGANNQATVTAADAAVGRNTVVEGVAITGGGGARGGGVSVRNGAAPTLRNLVIHGNTASDWGGGVAVAGGDPLLEGVTIRNNSSRAGAALALGSQSRATVRNSMIENNAASGARDAGAVYVFSGAQLTMQDSTIRGTSATSGGAMRVGGATVTITGGRIENSSATSLGGGVEAYQATLTIDGTTLVNNNALYGGALSVSGSTVTLRNCTVQNNRAQQAGGGLRVHGSTQIVIDNCRFVSNTTGSSSGGAIFVDQNTIEVRNSTFDGNRALVGGGIHLHYSPNATLQGNTLINNQATDGAAVYASGGRLRLVNNTISRNAVNNYGGGVVIQDRCDATVENNQITDNTAGIDGGGMIFQGGSTGTLSGNTISFNRATQVGGGMTIYNQASPTLRYNRFEGNQSNDGAGVQIEQQAAPVVEFNTFIANVANRYGGGIVVNHNATPTLRTNSIVRNRAQLSGGGILINSGSRAIVDRNSITVNTAGVGAGVLVMTDNNSQITNNYIARNTANEHGAGIYLTNSTALVGSNQITNNFARGLGGGAVILSASPRLENNLINRNRANQGGAGLYVTNSQSVLRHNTVADNGRNSNGDGLMLASGGAPRLSYNVIVGNDYGIRSTGGQPGQLFRNSLYDNRLANYSQVSPGSTDILTDPKLVTGPLGPYYLSQAGAGQGVNSPLVDACVETAEALGLHLSTTRTDGQFDRGLADIGFHFDSLPRKTFLPLLPMAG